MSATIYNTLLISLVPWVIIFSLRLIVTSCAFNSAVHPESHILPMEKIYICVRLGMVWSSHASSVKAVKYSRHGFLNCMVCPFGPPTLMNGPIFVDG